MKYVDSEVTADPNDPTGLLIKTRFECDTFLSVDPASSEPSYEAVAVSHAPEKNKPQIRTFFQRHGNYQYKDDKCPVCGKNLLHSAENYSEIVCKDPECAFNFNSFQSYVDEMKKRALAGKDIFRNEILGEPI